MCSPGKGHAGEGEGHGSEESCSFLDLALFV